MKKTKEELKYIEQAEDAAYNIENTSEAIKNMIFVSIISEDNPKYTEKVKQEILKRYGDRSINNITRDEWLYILQPVGDSAEKLANLLSVA